MSERHEDPTTRPAPPSLFVTMACVNNTAGDADEMEYVYAITLKMVLPLTCGPWHKDLRQSLIENAIERLGLDDDGLIEDVALIDVIDHATLRLQACGRCGTQHPVGTCREGGAQ